MPSEPAQVPSRPDETSASRAFQQLDPKEQKEVSKAQVKEEDEDWTERLKHLTGKEAEVFKAYNLTEEDSAPRDESGDLYKYEAVSGFFKQTDKSNGRLSVEEMLDASFGLIDDSPGRWENLKKRVSELQASAKPNETYKVLFCGRHGQGWHNLCATKVTAYEWEMDWCKRNGDGVHVWGPDAELTELGQNQALTMQKGWKKNLAEGAPLPELWLCSPLTRTADTMRLSFGDILDGQTPILKEGLREIYGVHTCDKRRSKSYLRERFPTYVPEEGMAEEDPLWKPDERESELNRRERLRKCMDDVFTNQPETYISITSHSAALRALLAVMHHIPISLATGEMIPLVIKATKQH